MCARASVCVCMCVFVQVCEQGACKGSKVGVADVHCHDIQMYVKSGTRNLRHSYKMA